MLSVAIMHAPWSGRSIDELVKAFPDAVVIEAAKDEPVMSVSSRAWGAVADDATRHLVLQDDAIPCAGLAGVLEQITPLPPCVLSLFDAGNRFLPALALMMPAQWARGFSGWMVSPAGDFTRHDNVALTRWLAITGRRALYTAPSIVDHADVPSLLGHPASRAVRFDAQPTEVAVGPSVAASSS